MAKTAPQNNEIDEVYGLVMDAIVTQKLMPSQKVSEHILCDMFDISRTISRNLMERLVAQQFLVSLSPRVTQIAPLTLLEIKQNFALRKVLLPETASLAGSKVDFNKLYELNDQLQNLLPITDDQSALKLLKTNKQLNLLLCQPVGYPLMLDWMRQLEDTAMRIYWLYVKTKKNFPYSNEQQSITFELMKTDDPKKIHSGIYDMICLTEDRILNSVFSHEQFYTQDLLV